MISKINHQNLNFSCTNAISNVNLYTGRLLLEVPILKIGDGNYEIGIKMLFDSQAKDNFPITESYNAGLPSGWRLNVHHCLTYQSQDDTYIYYDQNGFQHSFIKYKENCYYDTSGLGLTLEIVSGVKKIKDEVNNVIQFRSDNRVDKIISGINSRMVKRYIYEDNKLIGIYDERKMSNSISFEYEENRLVRIKSSENIYGLQLNYELDRLTEILECSGQKTYKNKLKMNYIPGIKSMLDYVLSADNTYLKFSYSGEKIYDVKTGVADVTSNFKAGGELYYLGDQHYFADDLYFGEKEIRQEGDTVDFVNEKILSSTKIYYESTNKTYVSNHNGIMMAYYFNEKGYSTAILEANGGNRKDLRMLEKMPGILMIDSGSDKNEESINRQYANVLKTNTEISTSNLMNSKFEAIKEYRLTKYNKYVNYICSFWLKLEEKLDNPKLKLTVSSYDSDSPSSKTAIVTFDRTAVGSWQYITIPIKIAFENIQWIKMNFEENNPNKVVRIADMRLTFSSHTSIHLTNPNGIQSLYLDDMNYINYTTSDNKLETANISENFYMSEEDIKATFLSKFKMGENNLFDLYYCDKTKRKWVKNVKLGIDESCEIGYDLNFGSDAYGINTRARYFLEMNTPNGDMYIRSFTHYSVEDNIGRCVRQITEAVDGNRKSHTETYVNLLGNVVKTQDEYGVKTFYSYDTYGNISSKIIKHDEISEQLIYTTSTAENTITTSDETSKTKAYYNETLGYPEKIEYNGTQEIGNILTTTFSYNVFKDQLVSVQNNDESAGKNFMRYDSNGRLSEVTPIGWNESDMYGYQFGYDSLGRPCNYYLTYKDNTNKKVQDKLVEKSIDNNNGTIETKQYRNTTPDQSTLKLNNYGKTEYLEENGKRTTFTRQNADSMGLSHGATEITEMYDAFEEKTYKYYYDDFNKIKEYEVKNKDDTLFYSIKKNSDLKENQTQYSQVHKELFYESYYSEISQDENKLLSSRLTQTRDFVHLAQRPNLNAGIQDYQYDKLGRLNKKIITINDGIIDQWNTKITNDIAYKPNTLLVRSTKTEISNTISTNRTYIDDYKYNMRGNIEEITHTTKINNMADVVFSTYEYDKANRLKKDSSAHFNPTSYNYNKDGSIDREISQNVTKKYVYKKGRLDYFYSTNSPSIQYYFEYDNFGNCTRFKNSRSLEWERGNLLKKYSSGNSANYFYNSQGIRFKKVLFNGEMTKYCYDGGKLLSEERNNVNLKYMYDAEGMIGFLKGRDEYYYVKDTMDNVIAILNKDEEVALYAYDTWGNCKILLEKDGIGTLNPIRWKSQYFDAESGFYYINGRYYSPEIKQYVSALSPELVMSNAGIVYGLNRYLLTIGNPVNLVFERYTIETNVPLAYEPKSLSGWDKFWRSKDAKFLAISFAVVGLIAAVEFGALALFSKMMITGGIALGIGASIAGYQTWRQGYGFERGFKDYINHEWALNVAIDSVVFLATVGFSKVMAFVKAGSKKDVLPNVNCGSECFKEGTIVKTEEGDKPIEEIKTGDKVWAYDEETGKKELKEVVQLFRNKTIRTTSVQIDEMESIVSTPNHPYYILDVDCSTPIINFEGCNNNEHRGQWIKAGDLKPGMKVLLSNGKNGIINSVINEELDELMATYNFEVTDSHTYYVGTEGILVHNDCVVNGVIDETLNANLGKNPNITSKYSLTESQALDAGEKFLGKGYTELSNNVFRNELNGVIRQFRFDPSSFAGLHSPGVSHFHLEILSKTGKLLVNNHIPLIL